MEKRRNIGTLMTTSKLKAALKDKKEYIQSISYVTILEVERGRIEVINLSIIDSANITL